MTQASPFPDLEPVLAALGALEPAAEAEIRRRADPALDAEIAAWELRLAPLALAAPPATPSDGLWDRIEAAIATAPRRVDEIARADATEWAPSSPGISIKVLVRGPAGAPRRFLLHLAPGAVVPSHPHEEDEECLVLSGDLVCEHERFGPGDYMRARAGGIHAPMHSPSGALLYVSIGAAQEL